MNSRKGMTHFANVITIALILVCFLFSMTLVNTYGRENSFTRVEEATQQVSQMFRHSLNETQNHLTVFADILAANDSNPGDLLQAYMENFCNTQSYSALCIHRANGSLVSYGNPPHDQVALPSFEEEIGRLPYVSPVYGTGGDPRNLYVYQAVPIVRDSETIAVLYGYLPLVSFPGFYSSSAYGGRGQFGIIDGDTGDYLMDAYHTTLGNVSDIFVPQTDIRKGYDLDTMLQDIRQGRNGFFVCCSRDTGLWYYTYYMPMGINNWSILMTIDEPTVFASYDQVNRMLIVLALCVTVLMLIHILALMKQQQIRNQRDRQNLHKSHYINSVQRALIDAHRTVDFVEQALKLIADEMVAETVLFLTLTDKRITNAQYWPSSDQPQAMDLVGRNAQEDFPVIYDLLAKGESVIYSGGASSVLLSPSGKDIFEALQARNFMVVPVADNAGELKGLLSAVNIAGSMKSCEMLECVTYDFYMALSNQQSHAIIKRMGTMDYLTRIKNRNSFEAELPGIGALDCMALWCLYVDANGLHEINNTQGHKAGDRMLCAVADALKSAFGEEYAYRLGGDEFLVFQPDTGEEEMLRRKEALVSSLAAMGYYISAGLAGAERDGVWNLEQAIAEAEHLMYCDKREFYQKNNIPEENARIPGHKA